MTLAAPHHFSSVGAWYDDFAQISDDEVVALLDAAREQGDRAATSPPRNLAGPGDAPADESGEVLIPTADGAELGGAVRLPPEPGGLVVFVHGSGSSRYSPRNNSVARYLEGRGFATLLFDLLTADEAGDRGNVFDIDCSPGGCSTRSSGRAAGRA